MRLAVVSLALWLVFVATGVAAAPGEAAPAADPPPAFPTAGAMDEAAALAGGLAAYEAGETARAAALLYPLAVAGDTAALTTVGDMHARGQFFAHDLCVAQLFYDKAARRGDPRSMRALAEAYRTGRGVRRDAVTATLWAQAAARAGDEAAVRLAMALEGGLSEAQAARLRQLAPGFRPEKQAPIDLYPVAPQWASEETWLAGMGLAPCHRPDLLDRARTPRPEPVWDALPAPAPPPGDPASHDPRLTEALAAYATRDYARTARLLYPLAVTGDPTALMTLGDMVEYGAFFPHDSCLAVAFYDKAARGGNPRGMHFLAFSFMLGEGVVRDLVRSGLWAHAASVRDVETAGITFEAASANMSEAEAAEVQRSMLSFEPRHQHPADLFVVPVEWGFSEAGLSSLGLRPCHLPKYLSHSFQDD
jgi:hypothetical protein